MCVRGWGQQERALQEYDRWGQWDILRKTQRTLLGKKVKIQWRPNHTGSCVTYFKISSML